MWIALLIYYTLIFYSVSFEKQKLCNLSQQIDSMKCHVRTFRSYLQSFRMRSPGLFVSFLGKSIFSMPFRMKVYVIIWSEPVKGGLWEEERWSRLHWFVYSLFHNHHVFFTDTLIHYPLNNFLDLCWRMLNLLKNGCCTKWGVV